MGTAVLKSIHYPKLNRFTISSFTLSYVSLWLICSSFGAWDDFQRVMHTPGIHLLSFSAFGRLQRIVCSDLVTQQQRNIVWVWNMIYKTSAEGNDIDQLCHQMNGGASISEKSGSSGYNSCKLWLFFLVSPFFSSSSFFLPPTFLPLLSFQLFSLIWLKYTPGSWYQAHLTLEWGLAWGVC